MILNATARLMATIESDWEAAKDVLDDWINDGAFALSPTEQKKAVVAFKVIRKKIPKQQMPSVIYRGLDIKRSQLKEVLAGGLELKPRFLTSWTASSDIALQYASNYYNKRDVGVVLAINTPKTALLYIDTSLIQSVLKTRLRLKQKEVVVEGNGVPRITRKNIVALVDVDGMPRTVDDFLESEK